MKKIYFLLILLAPFFVQGQDVYNELNENQNTNWYNAIFKSSEDSVLFYQEAMKLPQVPEARRENLENYQKKLQLYRDGLHSFVNLHRQDDSAAQVLLISCFRNIEINLDTLSSMAKTLDGKGLNNKYADYLLQEIAGRENDEVGKMLVPFSMPNVHGDMISSNNFKGHYVLVLFWASWCIPCRAEIPKMLSVYHQFKNSGFQVLAISVDSRKQNWLQAISQDKSDWHNLFDGSAWNTKVVRNYAIHVIPQSILVNPEGEIVAKNISPQGLQKLLFQNLK